MNLLTHSFLRSHFWRLSLIPHILTIRKSYRPHMGIYAESNHRSPHLLHILIPVVTISCPDHCKHLLSGLPASNFASLHPEWAFWNIKQIISIFCSESPNGFPSHLRSYSKPFFKALCVQRFYLMEVTDKHVGQHNALWHCSRFSLENL